jgi:hypothetical protein
VILAIGEWRAKNMDLPQKRRKKTTMSEAESENYEGFLPFQPLDEDEEFLPFLPLDEDEEFLLKTWSNESREIRELLDGKALPDNYAYEWLQKLQ